MLQHDENIKNNKFDVTVVGKFALKAEVLAALADSK